MKFDFFTLGGRFFWEDIYNYREWIIQRNIRTQKYRLLDPAHIRRDSGSFAQCKETLLKYIEAYELKPLYTDTIIILHGFGRTRNSVAALAASLQDLPVNIIRMNYASLQAGLTYHAAVLEQFIKNLDIQDHLCIINVGAACLLTRKFIAMCNNYRIHKIIRVVDINPINSGSDLAEIIGNRKFISKFFGQMLQDIETKRAVSLPKLPSEIDHGIIFCPSFLHRLAKRFLSHLDSFPFSTPPSEKSYSQKTKNIKEKVYFPLQSRELFDNCKYFVEHGDFLLDEEENVDKS